VTAVAFTVLQHAQAPTGGTVTLAATTAGSLIVVAVSNDAITGDPTTVTLTGSSDVFTKDVSAANTNPVANVNLSVWSDPGCSAGKTQVVVSGNLGTGVLTDVWEIAGGATSSPLQDKHGAAAPASTLQAAFDSGAMGSIPAGCFGIAAVIGIGSGGRAQASVTGSGTWTTETPLQPGSASQMLSARQNTLAAGTPKYAGTFTGPVAGAYWAAVVAAYKPAPATLNGAASLSAAATLTAAAIVTRRGSAALSAPASLTAAARVTELASAPLSAPAHLTAAGAVTSTAVLAAAASLTVTARATELAVAHLPAPAVILATGRVTRPGQAHLSAAPAMTAAGNAFTPAIVSGAAVLPALASVFASASSAPASPDLWVAYLAAFGVASVKWASWRMMRQAGGTDGTAGFLFGEAYEAQAVADQAYEAWRLAQQQAFPGRRG
jgi:hypothetical protein